MGCTGDAQGHKTSGIVFKNMTSDKNVNYRGAVLGGHTDSVLQHWAEEGAASLQSVLWWDRSSVLAGSPAVAMLLMVGADGKTSAVMIHVREETPVNVTWRHQGRCTL